jgi:phospholipid-translocating ATPase
MTVTGARIIYTGLSSAELPDNSVSTRKYTWLSFAPVSLLFQFRSISNVYFLFTACIMLIPDVSPISPISAIAPLCFVLLVSEIREFVEEYQKYVRDVETNSMSVNRITKNATGDTEVVCAKWQNLRPGDLVVLHDRDKIPADIVVVASSSNNFAYVETSNLDGETNLKTKQAPTFFGDTFKQIPGSDGKLVTDYDLGGLFGHKLTTEGPNPDMYRFKGSVGDDHLSAGNLLLRGCSLRNTPWAIGVCVYTGRETKAVLNTASAGVTPSKKTNVERRMNLMVLIVFGCQLLLILGSTLGYISQEDTILSTWYMNGLSSVSGGLAALTYFVLLNTIIPMSLWVALEVLKFLQANLMEADKAMTDKDRKLTCVAHSKNLHEELGQITHVFTDKTGTLTCNRMEFKGCAIGGKLFTVDPFVIDDLPDNTSLVVPSPKNTKRPKRRDLGFAGAIPISDSLLDLLIGGERPMSRTEFEFFKCIALCHSCERVKKQSAGQTVETPKKSKRNRLSLFGWFSPSKENNASPQPDNDGPQATGVAISQVYGIPRPEEGSGDSLDEKLSRYIYQSTSPDEAALVSSAADIGFIFHKRLPSAVQIDIKGEAVVFEVLHQVAFSSDRRMMSIVVRDPDGKIFVFTKGADSSVIPRCMPDAAVIGHTQWAVEIFADKGLRTLCIARRELQAEMWADFQARINAASADLEHRDARVAEIDKEIEQELTLLGCTAVEDKLQSGVHETVMALRNAGIAVCMITGDKRETAVNIARSCKLVNSDHNVYTMSTQDNMYGGGNFIHLDSLMELVGDGRADPLWGMTTEAKTLPTDNNSSDGSRVSRKGSMLPPEESMAHGLAAKTMYQGSSFGSSLSPISSATKQGKTVDKFCIVLDGAALSILLANPNQTRKLLSVMAHPQCEAAVFCRVNPKQKGLIVRSCRDRLKSGCVLAIGDGANDISMIKEAHVGIGIFGEEGWQAAGSADYAITKFKDLYRLLFIHGRWNYMRITFFITFFMYKNYAFTFLQFWMASLSSWSAISVLDSVCLLAFNSVFMTAPLFAAGLFDMDVHPDADRPSKGTLAHPPSVTDENWYVQVVPKLYGPGQRNELFRAKRVFSWLILGLVHSVVIFFGVFGSWAFFASPAIQADGFNSSFPMLQQSLYTTLLMMLSLFHAVFIQKWTWIYLLFNIVFNVTLYIAFVAVYDKLSNAPYNYIAAATFSNWSFWFTLGVTLAVCVLPLLVLRFLRRSLAPTLVDAIQSRKLGVFDRRDDSLRMRQIRSEPSELNSQ